VLPIVSKVNRDFYFWELHPVATITTIFWGPSNATALSECFSLLLLHTHYMFRPLRAVFSLRINHYVCSIWWYPVGDEKYSLFVILVIIKILKLQLRLTEP
jgi:hypothetical protein